MGEEPTYVYDESLIYKHLYICMWHQMYIYIIYVYMYLYVMCVCVIVCVCVYIRIT